MELLRLLSMFLVLVIHANTAFKPWPITQTDVIEGPFNCAFRYLIESLSVVCVNAFILLSGWFGIKFSFERLFSFVFQVLFFSVVTALIPGTSIQMGHWFVDVLTLNQYWFVRAYIILFILSPLLNLFAEKAPRELFKSVLIAFFLMQTVFSYLSNSVWFDDGFSPIPFLGLYLLSRYIRVHRPFFSSLRKEVDLCIYFGISFLLTLLSIVLLKRFATGGRMFNYTNPLVIVSSTYFVLYFSKIRMKQSPVLNWIAVSSVGAYLLHMNPLFFQPYYIQTLRSFSAEESPFLAFCMILLFILTVFTSGVLLDKIRGVLWKWVRSFVVSLTTKSN